MACPRFQLPSPIAINRDVCDQLTIDPPRTVEFARFEYCDGQYGILPMRRVLGSGSISAKNRHIGPRVWEFPAGECQPFVAYDKSDESWAIPLGFGRWEVKPLEEGDLIDVEMFSPQVSGKAVVTRSYCEAYCESGQRERMPYRDIEFCHYVEFEFVNEISRVAVRV